MMATAAREERRRNVPVITLTSFHPGYISVCLIQRVYSGYATFMTAARRTILAGPPREIA